MSQKHKNKLSIEADLIIYMGHMTDDQVQPKGFNKIQHYNNVLFFEN